MGAELESFSTPKGKFTGGEINIKSLHRSSSRLCALLNHNRLFVLLINYQSFKTRELSASGITQSFSLSGGQSDL